MMSEVIIAEGCPVLPPVARAREIPYLVVKILTGGSPVAGYKGKKDVVAIRWCGAEFPFHLMDYKVAAGIANEINEEMMIGNESVRFLPETFEKFHRMASKKLGMIDSGRPRTKRMIMLKDQYGGSGWWRMVLPAKYMKLDGWEIDVSASGIDFDTLLEYDVIFVQRIHDWDSFYVLERIVRAGKRLVYDLDDDMFRIPMSNPASQLVGRDQQVAARECMRLAHAVTCTTEVMKERVVLEDIDASKVHVLPNALDNDDRWLPVWKIGTPDKKLRIFWQGGATHATDWLECIGAVDDAMQEFPNLILMIMGSLPPVVMEMLSEPHWHGKVEYLKFSDVETYYETIHHIKADVGIAPLEDTTFNYAKSPIKWLEYSLMGMPTVASAIDPYSSVIEDGVDGKLVSGRDEWREAIFSYLRDPRLRMTTVKNARSKARELFDLKVVADKWEKILTGETL